MLGVSVNPLGEGLNLPALRGCLAEYLESPHSLDPLRVSRDVVADTHEQVAAVLSILLEGGTLTRQEIANNLPQPFWTSPLQTVGDCFPMPIDQRSAGWPKLRREANWCRTKEQWTWVGPVRVGLCYLFPQHGGVWLCKLFRTFLESERDENHNEFPHKISITVKQPAAFAELYYPWDCLANLWSLAWLRKQLVDPLIKS